ncbi:MAG TPA: hypothetical protein VGB62_00085 [Allosphingosinicella sp.]|jgi:hypothetical protein
MINRTFFVALGAAAIVAGTAMAGAQPRKQAPARPQTFDALMRCRGISDAAQRLSCFDSASAALEEAANSRELLLVDRQQAREAKRGLFGLDLPNFNPFGGGGDDGEDEIRSIESTVASASDLGGNWLVKLADGSTWLQTDGKIIAVAPRQGHKVKVSKAALGSYMMRVNGQPAVRVKRRI